MDPDQLASDEASRSRSTAFKRRYKILKKVMHSEGLLGGMWTVTITYRFKSSRQRFCQRCSTHRQEISILIRICEIIHYKKQYHILLSICMLGNLSCFFCCLLTFYKITSSKNTIRVSNSLDTNEDRHSVSLDLGPNSL